MLSMDYRLSADNSCFPAIAHVLHEQPDSDPAELIDTLERALRDVAALPPTVSPVVAVAQRALADFEHIRGAERLTAISATVAQLLRVTYQQLISKSRTQHLSHCRQVAIYICRALGGVSYPVLGTHFRRNHTTARWAVKTIATRMRHDAGFAHAIEQMEREVTTRQHHYGSGGLTTADLRQQQVTIYLPDELAERF
jgi:chromosomal replication initiation ATPase DnaA